MEELVSEPPSASTLVPADQDTPELTVRRMIKLYTFAKKIGVLMVVLALKNLAMILAASVCTVTEVINVKKTIQQNSSVIATLA